MAERIPLQELRSSSPMGEEFVKAFEMLDRLDGAEDGLIDKGSVWKTNSKSSGACWEMKARIGCPLSGATKKVLK